MRCAASACAYAGTCALIIDAFGAQPPAHRFRTNRRRPAAPASPSRPRRGIGGSVCCKCAVIIITASSAVQLSFERREWRAPGRHVSRAPWVTSSARSRVQIRVEIFERARTRAQLRGRRDSSLHHSYVAGGQRYFAARVPSTGASLSSKAAHTVNIAETCQCSVAVSIANNGGRRRYMDARRHLRALSVVVGPLIVRRRFTGGAFDVARGVPGL